MLTLSKDLLAALRILGSSVAPTNDLLRTGSHQLKLGKVPVKNRHILDIFLIESRGHVGAVSLKLRRFAGYFNCFSRGPQLQLEIDASVRIHRNRHTLL